MIADTFSVLIALVLAQSVPSASIDPALSVKTDTNAPAMASENLLDMGFAGYAGCMKMQLLGRSDDGSDAALQKLVGETPAEAKRLAEDIIAACAARKAAITTELTDLIRKSRKGKFLAVDPVEFHALKFFSDELDKMDGELIDNLQNLQKENR
jgi:hypothetical protein